MDRLIQKHFSMLQITEEGTLKSQTPFCTIDFLLGLHLYVKKELNVLQNTHFPLRSCFMVLF